MDTKTIKRKLIIYLFIFTVVAIIIEVTVLGIINANQTYETSEILLNQIEDILENNANDEERLLASLKEDYIGKAKAVAYTLNYNDKAKSDASDLQDLADIMQIDEIHLFDSEGVIFSSVNPKYIGMSFDSGKQIGYFKPMLNDLSLTMCQDVTPNTAEARKMMYAITWDPTGTYMIQVGIEPVRLLEEFRQNSIETVVSQMPAYEGMDIYVSNAVTGRILGASNADNIGKTLREIGLVEKTEGYATLTRKTMNIDGFLNYLSFRQSGEYIITVVRTTRTGLENVLLAVIVEVLWILLAGITILIMVVRLTVAQHRIKEQVKLVSSISDSYHTMHYVDLTTDAISTLRGNGIMTGLIAEGYAARVTMKKAIELSVSEEYKAAALEFADLDTIGERLKGKKSMFMEVVDVNIGWLRLSFTTVETDENGVATRIIIGTQDIDEGKKREEELSVKANRDELTGLLNRRAYENDLVLYQEDTDVQNFVYAAVDINGLKMINDNLGHAAGDEFIQAAAKSLKQVLGPYGKIYRIGGDEFVTIFHADDPTFKTLIAELDDITSNWHGSIFRGVPLAAGYVFRREFPDESLAEIAKIADKRMYKSKEEYYSKAGIDRRGQSRNQTTGSAEEN